MRGAWTFMAAATLPACLLLALPTTASANALCDPFAEGGAVSLIIVGNEQFCVHQFTDAGISNFNAVQTVDVEYLIVGGGGGGSSGGGGAGGMVWGQKPGVSGSNTVIVGAGGGIGEAGNDSAALGEGAGGGGRGGQAALVTLLATGGDGRFPSGSGGGAGAALLSILPSGGRGAPPDGKDGAGASCGASLLGSCIVARGGGGGGAGSAGVGRNGGNGQESSITGAPIFYAGGGAASDGSAGNGQVRAGGGGNAGQPGKNGSVIIRYLVNSAPVADAGLAATLAALSLATLDGSGSSDPNDNIESYEWEQIAGTNVTLDDPTLIFPSFTVPQPANGVEEELVFELTVTDTFGLTSTDTVTITVQAAAVLAVTKTVAVFSEDGSDCNDFNAAQPSEPTSPAAIPGACIQYTISVTNEGLVDAEGVSLTDALPASLSFQEAALDHEWGTLTTSGCPGVGCEVTVNSGTIAFGATATLMIRAIIN